MKVLIQRVTQASVTVSGECVGNIGPGLLVFVGIEKTDDQEIASKAIDRLLRYRVFEDEAGKTNLSVQDIKGEMLIVSQFTLVADTGKGLRPSFSRGATPQQAEALFDFMVAYARGLNKVGIETGQFGADMKVSLLNDGPVTFIMEL